MSKPLLILDAGHNEYVAGKRSPDSSLYEWDFNNKMQRKIEAIAKANGMDVYLTNPSPQGKDEIGLSYRANLANNKWNELGRPNAVFVSLHANAFGTGWTSPRGTETFVSTTASANSKRVAQLVNDSVVQTIRSIDPNGKDRGVKVNNWTVIYKAAMPSILVEYAFYSNEDDLKILKNNQDELAACTVRAICQYFGLSFNGNVTTNPAPVVTPDDTKSELQKRADYVGGRCAELQQKLNSLGYNCGTVDGIFGKDTNDALMRFQRANGLTVDGYAGPNTFAKLDALLVSNVSNGNDWIRRLQQECNNQGFSNQKVDGFAGPNTLNGCPLLVKGASGGITRLLQERLNALGYSCGSVDGIFGTGTKNAVKQFQSAHGLTVDGKVGQATWSKLLGL